MAEAVEKTADLSGTQSAAILMMLMTKEEAASILSRLDPDEVQRLGEAMFTVSDISQEQIESVLDNFTSRARARTTLGFDADSQIRGIMELALGADRAENVMARITPVAHTTVLDTLKWMDARTIATLIENEHPQIAALVLACLDPVVAADVLEQLDDGLQPDIIYRIATLDTVSVEALEELERLLLGQVSRVGATNGGSNAGGAHRGGAAEAAQIVNNMSDGEQRLMKAVSKMDKSLARAIEDEMFVFDDLNDLDDRNLGTLLRAIDNDILVVALKGAQEELKTRMLGCMSKRAAEAIEDEMSERGPMRVSEVQEAQKQVLNIARKLAEGGSIMLGGKGDDYV
ncbi:MAG: flagellar motor switch protein FliG [Zymomonas mobilis subsp. pomaceae]|uniref:Flagellar motor switch protein FliG n=1 Tax=Zymomonas mobilis subsp. pomaceae (strain ATCC 29192 / DSM 22645 / JCM 10191 / CCUG 17912 / NBRC 13757 / NCIMB 11200 / NRRL B-4491 / Barker I) TaxID=579138 RepID=F8ERN6_ZYMMT|nr:flagellar motor switch protein FliG [Zymomonas mobilis]AEI37494.1 flagellar motor switch protein FliG [Zymomonas mobilis subsp. pomaceae ATCC 29192]MDX5948862.1 flagellar motor switch protein FliG [Zymomonas mobilis subsp. pomaceae]GEB88669.1 flagellar motor switch protein FliG [Zymomonas mobilis subsp. pomaceae]